MVHFASAFIGLLTANTIIVRVAPRQGQSVHLCICAFGPMPKCLNDKTVVGDFLISLVSSSRQRTKHVRHCCRETARDRIDADRVFEKSQRSQISYKSPFSGICAKANLFRRSVHFDLYLHRCTDAQIDPGEGRP